MVQLKGLSIGCSLEKKFSLAPFGKEGREFVQELTRLFCCYGKRSALKIMCFIEGSYAFLHSVASEALCQCLL